MGRRRRRALVPSCRFCFLKRDLVWMGCLRFHKFHAAQDIFYCRACLYNWVQAKLLNRDFDGLVLVM